MADYVSATRDIPATVEAIWEVLTDPGSHARTDYQLKELPTGGTRVTLSQDFSACTPEVRERFGLPLWTTEDLQSSLAKLEESVA